MGLFKWLGIHEHEWSPWKTVAKGDIHFGLPPLIQIFTKDPRWYVGGEMKKQERTCRTCGLSEVKTEKMYY
jgi:hypothetical protein